MRTVRQLLLVLRNSLEKGPKVGYANMGLCGEVEDLLNKGIINGNEFDTLFHHLKDNKPTSFQHKEFYLRQRYSYWWPPMGERWGDGRTTRIKFLNKLISEQPEESSFDLLWVFVILGILTIFTLMLIFCVK